MLARVIPVLGYDRGMVRLRYERRSEYNFPLKGLKKVLSIMESCFQEKTSTDERPSVTLQFSCSNLDSTYRKTNDLLVAGYCQNDVTDYRNEFRTLLDNAPPGTNELLAEGSGCALLSVFLNQVVADFTPLIQSAADATFLRGLEENVLRIASDFYWAFKLPTYLSSNGSLTIEKEQVLRSDLNKMLLDKIVVIPEDLVSNLLAFVTYVLKGIFHLNKFANGSSLVSPEPSPEGQPSRERYRIV